MTNQKVPNFFINTPDAVDYSMLKFKQLQTIYCNLLNAEVLYREMTTAGLVRVLFVLMEDLEPSDWNFEKLSQNEYRIVSVFIRHIHTYKDDLDAPTVFGVMHCYDIAVLVSILNQKITTKRSQIIYL